MEKLITALIALGLEFGPELVADGAAVIKGVPRPEGMSDADYIAMLVAKVTANTAAVDKADDAIQEKPASA